MSIAKCNPKTMKWEKVGKREWHLTVLVDCFSRVRLRAGEKVGYW